MKLREFKLNIVKVAKGHQVDFFIAEYNHIGYLHIEISGERFAQINTHEPGVFTIVLNNKLYEMLSLSQVTVLIDYIEKYAKTPIREREEEKKYFIKLKGTDSHKIYVNYDNNSMHYLIHTKDETSVLKTKFTEREIEEFGLTPFTRNTLFQMVEVSDDE